MSLYFFHLSGAPERIDDPDGEEFSDDAAARAAAVCAAREIVGDGIKVGRDATDGSFEVKNEAGQIVATVPFSEALEPLGRFTSQRHAAVSSAS